MFTRRHRPETDPERQQASVEGADPDKDQAASPRQFSATVQRPASEVVT